MLLQVGDMLPQGFTEAAQLGGPLVSPGPATTVTLQGTLTVINLIRAVSSSTINNIIRGG